jgi:hypothetical protein
VMMRLKFAEGSMVPVMSSTVSIYFQEKDWLVLDVNLMGVVFLFCVLDGCAAWCAGVCVSWVDLSVFLSLFCNISCHDMGDTLLLSSIANLVFTFLDLLSLAFCSLFFFVAFAPKILYPLLLYFSKLSPFLSQDPLKQKHKYLQNNHSNSQKTETTKKARR